MLLALLTVCALASGAVAFADGDEGDEAPAPIGVFGRPSLAPKFELHGFANVDALASRVRPDSGDKTNSSAFALGELDLYIVSQLTDGISFLGETVFELDDEGSTGVDVERLILKYTVSDRFWVSFGRHHTTLGYWSNVYHHGLYLQPTIERPLPLRFEDDGGILPIHGVGVAAGGRLFHRGWSMDYRANVTNGRGPTRDYIQGSNDLNDQKALTVQLSLVRDGQRFWHFGPMLHLDRIPADPGVPGRDGEISEAIAGAHFVYRDDVLEVLAEYFHIRHQDRVSNMTFDHPAYFALAVWRPWRIRPYIGIERTDIDAADPYFADLPGDVRRVLGGVRIDTHPYITIKVELRHEHFPQEEADVVAAQLAFSF